MFQRSPKSYYGAFSFFFKSKLYSLLAVYILLVLAISLGFSFCYEIVYAGPEVATPLAIKWFHKWYFSLLTFISPGFTEFLPSSDASRLLASINCLIGLLFNALFLSILVARALQPHEPFEVVSFLAYDPRQAKLSCRFYSTLPASCYNLSFKLFRFLILENDIGHQMGTTREISISPTYRNALLPNYAILIRAEVDLDENPQNASTKARHTRKKVPLEWLLKGHEKCPEGHFYITIEAETPYGKMFQTKSFYLTEQDIKVGCHQLLNEGDKLTVENWYEWKSYRWETWGRYNNIPEIEKYINDPVLRRYSQMKSYYLVTDVGEFPIVINGDSHLDEAIIESLPLEGEAKNIGGELFCFVDLNIPFDSTEKETFEIGDLVYWRSQKEEKFAIALFYGNTKFGDGNAPTASSACMKFGVIRGDCKKLGGVATGSTICIECRQTP